MSIKILGISCYYHDSAAALIIDGNIIAAAQEERFTRKKHDEGFPAEAIQYCLKAAGIRIEDLDHIVFYEKPLVKFERLLETYLEHSPRGLPSFLKAMPLWIKEKLYIKKSLRRELAKLGSIPEKELPELLFTSHHQSHAASAFFPSPYENAAVLCLDGIGEWASSSVWRGHQNQLTPQWEIHFPHSLGLLYSAFTYYTGFKVNSAEYKVMGLAPYGEPKYVDLIFEKLIDLKEDGSFKMDMQYFNYATGLRMTNRRFDEIFGGPPRQAEAPLTQREMDLARSVQEVTERIVLKIAKRVRQDLGEEYLCLAGGVALNCVANGKLKREKIFKDIWIQPSAGDAGGAVGAALSVWYEFLQKPRTVSQNSMQGSYLGPNFSADEIEKALQSFSAHYQKLDSATVLQETAKVLAEGNVVGWFQGRMEFGPRALGNRSILGDPRNSQMQSVMNLKIKQRESFRPFAPAVLAERSADFFELEGPSPYMLLVADVHASQRIAPKEENEKLFGIEKLKIPRSKIPAITHVDYSARVQTVHPETNSRFHALISEFEKQTGCPVLVNTSFNVRGEPIVCTPEDAYRCFMATEMDYLVVENFILSKKSQQNWDKREMWERKFELD